MKRVRLIMFFIALLSLFLLSSCLSALFNEPPKVEIIEPSTDYVSSTYRIVVKITDDVSVPPEFEFSIDGEKISGIKSLSKNEKTITIETATLTTDGMPDNHVITILAKASDNFGITTVASKTVKVVRPPEITFLEPKYDSEEGIFDFKFKIKDIDAISPKLEDASIEIYDSKDLEGKEKTLLYSKVLHISNPSGENEYTTPKINTYLIPRGNYIILRVTATDWASNTAIEEKKVKVGGDPPELKIIEPINKYIKPGEDLKIKAEITDDVVLTDIKLEIKDSNQKITLTPTLTYFSRNHVILEKVLKRSDIDTYNLEDTFIVEIKATDKALNETQISFTVSKESSPISLSRSIPDDDYYLKIGKIKKVVNEHNK